MIPQSDKPIVARWIASEASLFGEEIIWQDEWTGYCKAQREVGDIVFTIELTARANPQVDDA